MHYVYSQVVLVTNLIIHEEVLSGQYSMGRSFLGHSALRRVTLTVILLYLEYFKVGDSMKSSSLSSTLSSEYVLTYSETSQ